MTEPQPIYLLPGESVTIEAREPDAPSEHPWTDARQDFPINTSPDNPWFVANGVNAWPRRTTDQINSITIHHTMSHKPFGLANWIVHPYAQGGKGLPTTQYTFWVVITGEIMLCVDIEDALWHDNGGFPSHHLSIGLAGRWDQEAPPTVQMRAAADLCKYLMQVYPSIKTIKGHCDYFSTVCPGWNEAGWKDQFYNMLSPTPSYALRFMPTTPDYSEICEAE